MDISYIDILYYNIYFSSNDGNVYAVDINGNMLDGFPMSVESPVTGSVMFADIDNNGKINLINIKNGFIYNYELAD